MLSLSLCPRIEESRKLAHTLEILYIIQNKIKYIYV